MRVPGPPGREAARASSSPACLSSCPSTSHSDSIGELSQAKRNYRIHSVRCRMPRLISSVLILVLMFMVGSFRVSSVEAHPQHRDAPPPPDPALEKMQKQAEKQRNEQRQSDLKRDTDQLFKLASELKKSVDSSNQHVLSLEVIRKAEDIEKLAKSVRTKMKADGYGSTIPEQ